MAVYKLLDKAYFDQVYNAGEEVTVDDSVIPGPHMVPVDAAAKAAAKKAGIIMTSKFTVDAVPLFAKQDEPKEGDAI